MKTNHRSMKRLWALLLAVAVGGCASLEKNEEEKKPELRTLADLERGKKNVKSVAEELHALFSEKEPELVKNLSERKAIPAYYKIVRSGEGRSTLVYRPRYTTAKKVARALEGVLPLNSLVEPVVGQNLVVISASDKEIDGCRQMIEAMDVAQAQILIEAKVVEVIFSDAMLRNLSVNYTGGSGSIGAETEIPGQTTQPTTGMIGNFTPISGADTLNIAFKWLETAQNAKVLSSPTILLSSCDETSKITTGEEIPIQEANTVSNNLSITTKFKSVGVTLEVEPSLINDDNVTLRVFPKVSTVTRYETISTGTGTGATKYSVPVIAARSVETYLKMHHKQVVMMGGLYSSNKTLQEQRIPGLSDLPLVGEMFTGKNLTDEVTQLIFFLKVHIIPPEDAGKDFFFDIDHNAKLNEALGEMVRSTESFPIRKGTFRKLAAEIFGALPGAEEAKRDHFRRQDLKIRSQGDTPQPEVQKKTVPAEAGK